MMRVDTATLAQIEQALADGTATEGAKRIVIHMPDCICAACEERAQRHRPAKPRKPKSRELVAPAFRVEPRGNNAIVATWTVPLETKSESNQRAWQGKSNRTQAARRAVSQAFGPTLAFAARFAEHYHGGGTIRVTFTRLGGKRMDRSNIPAAMKGVEDAVALILGADDGDDRWDAEFEQETGGRIGVRIQMEKLGESL